MVVKAFFIVPMFIGAVFALAIGIYSNWSTDIYALPLIMGVFLGVSLGLAARRLKSDSPVDSKWGGDIQARKKVIVEVIIFISLLIGIAMPSSAKRGVVISYQHLTTRSIMIACALLILISLVIKFIRYRQNR